MEAVGDDRCRNSDSSNHLRELLRQREDESGDGDRRNGPSRTLGSVLYADKRILSNRTLLDIIREDSGKDGNANTNNTGKKRWKHLKDKLRRKRSGAGAGWTSSVHIPASDISLPSSSSRTNSLNNHLMNQRVPTRLSEPESTQNPAPSQPELESRVTVASQDTTEEGMGETAEVEAGEEAPVRMSLMALLAETDRELGIDGVIDDDDDEEDEESVGKDGGGVVGGEYNNCCVCMVRHKGAALIPCGHTFCRLCSRELWVQRGNCPLCNGYILEILDIF